jgi:hypothetical protein
MAMNDWGDTGRARAALATVVTTKGVAALSDRDLLSGMLGDLMPDSPPREVNALLAAAEADVPGRLRDRQAQRISAGTAVTQAAAMLEERTGLSPEACQWATRLMAETLGLPMATPPPPPTPAPSPTPTPTPVPTPDPTPPKPLAKRDPAIVAGCAALVCALSLPLQALTTHGVVSWYGWEITLYGLILVIAAALALRGGARDLGVGLIFGAAVGVLGNFLVESLTSGLGAGAVAGSVIATLAALAAAIAAIASFADAIRGKNVRGPLDWAYCLAAIGFVVAFDPGDVQYLDTSGNWVTVSGWVGPGVHGRLLLAGLVVMAALILAPVIAVLLPPGSGLRAGVLIGWLAFVAAGLVDNVVAVLYPDQRPAAAFWVSWAVALIVGGLTVALLVGARGRQAVSSQPTLVS